MNRQKAAEGARYHSVVKDNVEVPAVVCERCGAQFVPDGTEQQLKSPEKTTVSSSSAAESAAIDAQLAIVIDAWPSIAPHSRSIMVGMARKAIEKAASDRS